MIRPRNLYQQNEENPEKSPLESHKSYTGLVDSDDLETAYCEHAHNLLVISIFLKRSSKIRRNLFNYVVLSEAREESLIGPYLSVYSSESWPKGNVVFVKKIMNEENASRLAHFLNAGIQLRIKAAINQSSMIAIRSKSKSWKHRLLDLEEESLF